MLRATDSAVAEALRQEAADLREALRNAGYRSAEVSVGSWNGDRLKAVSQLMRRFSGMDVEA